MSKKVFLTCNHVINGPASPHQDGDTYLLVGNLSDRLTVHAIENARTGTNLVLEPESDLALLASDQWQQESFAAISYGYVKEGMEIGIAGYPIPELRVTPEDQLVFPGLIFRVAKSVVTARYTSTLNSEGLPPITNAPVIEVNFLFVPGNSGGPIFDAERGQVVGFVHGFRHFTVSEKVVEAKLIPNLPEGVGKTYIENLSGIYSLGIKLDRVRARLEEVGVLL